MNGPRLATALLTIVLVIWFAVSLSCGGGGGDDPPDDGDDDDNDTGDDDDSGDDDDTGDDDDDDTGDDDDDDSSDPVILSPNAVILDDAVAAQATVEEDRLLFPLAGNENLLDLTVGNVLVSGYHPGFLREIVSIATEGEEIVIGTELGSLSQVIVSGDASFEIPVSEDDKAAHHFHYDFSGEDLYQEGGLHVWIEEGEFDFNLTIDVTLDYTDDRYGLEAGGPVTSRIVVHATSTGIGASGELPAIPIKEVPFLYWIPTTPPLPVAGTVTLAARLGFDATVQGQADGKAGLEGSSNIELGAIYDDGDFRKIASNPLEFEVIEPVVDYDFYGIQVKGYAYADLEVKLYDQVGPYVDFGPYARLTYDVDPELPCELTVKAGLEAHVGLRMDPIKDLVGELGPATVFSSNPITLYPNCDLFTIPPEVGEPEVLVNDEIVTGTAMVTPDDYLDFYFEYDDPDCNIPGEEGRILLYLDDVLTDEMPLSADQVCCTSDHGHDPMEINVNNLGSYTTGQTYTMSYEVADNCGDIGNRQSFQFVVWDCIIDGIGRTEDEVNRDDGCLVCDPDGQGRSHSWTRLADCCYIEDHVYDLGDINPDNYCQRCDDDENLHAWTCFDRDNCCQIGGECYENGTVNPGDECLECDYDEDPDGWTKPDPCCGVTEGPILSGLEIYLSETAYQPAYRFSYHDANGLIETHNDDSPYVNVTATEVAHWRLSPEPAELSNVWHSATEGDGTSGIVPQTLFDWGFTGSYLCSEYSDNVVYYWITEYLQIDLFVSMTNMCGIESNTVSTSIDNHTWWYCDCDLTNCSPGPAEFW